MSEFKIAKFTVWSLYWCGVMNSALSVANLAPDNQLGVRLLLSVIGLSFGVMPYMLCRILPQTEGKQG